MKQLLRDLNRLVIIVGAVGLMINAYVLIGMGYRAWPSFDAAAMGVGAVGSAGLALHLFVDHVLEWT